MDDLPKIRATEVGEYIRHHSCERRFKLGFNNREEARRVPFSVRLFNAIDPVLQASGRNRENEWENSLQNAGLFNLTPYQPNISSQDRFTSWQDFIQQVEVLDANRNAYGREIDIESNLGAFHVNGRIDFVIIRWVEGKPELWIVETKDSRRDRTYHRVQVTMYRMIVKELLENRPISIHGIQITSSDIRCVVARIDESTNEPQSILELEPLSELAREESDINWLLSDAGPLLRITQTELSELHYRLDLKCDGCVFNTHCLPESGLERRLELLGIEPSTIQVLKEAGISTIDDLAVIDTEGIPASQIRNNPGFGYRLDLLKLQAQARRRTLPGGMNNPDEFPVTFLPYTTQGELPEHEINGHRLVRVYLNVDYDYVENRLVALAAHVTKSDGQLNTGDLRDKNGQWIGFDPIVKELLNTGTERPLQGEDIVELLPAEWTGRYEVDTGREMQLIQNFFRRLIAAIDAVARTAQAPVHFYVWSRLEMTHLIEACSRVDSRLLSHLRELLGCREDLEQLIYSCLQQEVSNRFALGWTGRGLAVVTSLTWFGRRYHWSRIVSGSEVRLDTLFTQDIFDFKTTLDLKADNTWAQNEDERASSHKFEIRSRFYDSITAPYWYAYWRARIFPDPNDPNLPSQVRSAIRRYQQAVRQPNNLVEYLRARTQALRWIEERVRFKNSEIAKPLLTIADLPDFELGVASTARAAIDFLVLDHHVKLTDWITKHLAPPSNRVPLGETIPVKNLRSLGQQQLTAELDLEAYGLDKDALNARIKIHEGSLVRVSVYSGDPHVGQTLRQLLYGGTTCKLQDIDWETEQITLTAIPSSGSRYLLSSIAFYDEGPVFDGYATIDENVSDFVSGEVERRLRSVVNSPAFHWFDPVSPRIPDAQNIPSAEHNRYQVLLVTLNLDSGRRLATSQIDSILEGLNAQTQLLQGPPGTGKTTTTAVATLLRILHGCQHGDIVLIGATTHTALDNLLQRIDSIIDAFSQHAQLSNLVMPNITLSKVHSSRGAIPENQSLGRIEDFPSQPSKTFVARARRNSVLVIGGTTVALLKLARELPGRDLPNGLNTPLLVIDEASMMVFPHFLALATLVEQRGQIMLAGDHRQLAPIVAHDWEREDRPPVILYQPYVSAYQAIDKLARNHPDVSAHAIKRSSLNFTFRLPPAIRDLIARLYRLDDIELEGLANNSLNGSQESNQVSGSWEKVWQGDTGLFLVLHSERNSRQSNELEVQIIEHILSANPDLPANSVAIVTPYRMQRTLLQSRLNIGAGPVGIVDTVERLQGGERPTVVVSAVASDPHSISANAQFILNLNRSNVAFSRSEERLIVVCSEELINHIPAELDNYDSAMLWKALRYVCSQLLAETALDSATVHILTPPVDHIR